MKKIVLGSLISIFLLISINAIGPVNVQATEANDFQDKLLYLSKQLKNDKNLEKIVNDDVLRNIMSEILSGKDRIDDYIDYIKTKFITELDSLKATYGDDIEELKDLAINIVQDANQQTSNSIYKIDASYNVLSIVELKDGDADENAVVLSSNGNIKYNDIDIGLIGILLMAAAAALAVVVFVLIVIIGVIQAILVKIGELFDQIELVGLVVAALLGVVGVVALILEEILEQVLPELLNEIKKTSKNSTKSYSMRLKYHLQLIGQKMQQFMNNIRTMFNYQHRYCVN